MKRPGIGKTPGRFVSISFSPQQCLPCAVLPMVPQPPGIRQRFSRGRQHQSRYLAARRIVAQQYGAQLIERQSPSHDSIGLGEDGPTHQPLDSSRHCVPSRGSSPCGRRSAGSVDRFTLWGPPWTRSPLLRRGNALDLIQHTVGLNSCLLPSRPPSLRGPEPNPSSSPTDRH